MVVVLVGYWKAAPGRGDEVARVVDEVTPIMRAEPGLLLYIPNRSVDDPDRFMLYEQYVDRETREAHRDTEHFKKYIEGTIWPMLEDRRVEIYDLMVP